MAPAFVSSAQVDAVAVCTLQNVQGGDSGKANVSVLAVAQSQLEGNLWSGGVTLLNAQTSERLGEVQLETGVASLAWCSADCSVLALGCDDGNVCLAKLSTGETLTFEPVNADSGMGLGHDDVVTGVSSSSMEKTQLASCSWDLTVKLWDITVMDQAIATFHGHTDLIWGMARNPTQAHVLCSASQDSTVQVWDTRRPQSAAVTVPTVLPAMSVDWHPKQPTIFVVGLEDGRVCTHDVRSPHLPLSKRQTHSAAVHVVKYSPYHDDLLATGGDDGKAFVTGSWSSRQSTDLVAGEVCRRDHHSAHWDYVRALDWCQLTSPLPHNDAVLVTGSWDKTVHKWNGDDCGPSPAFLATASTLTPHGKSVVVG